MKYTRATVSFAVLALLLVGLFLSGQDAEESAPVQASETPQPRSVRPRATPPPPPTAVPPTLAALDDATVEAALALAEPEAPVLHCDVTGLLEDGVYETRPAVADHPVVRRGVLTVVTHEGTGRVQLERRLENVGTLSWGDGACTVTAPRTATVAGTLTWPDGSPAAGHDVRGCFHGEFGTTDEDGRWSVDAVVGTTCHPMAFVERADGSFGKSNVVDVNVDADGVDGVKLLLPDEAQIWSEAQQEALIVMLIPMFDQRLSEQQDRLAAAQDALDAAQSDEERQVLQALRDNEQVWVDWIQGELERLEDPEEQLDAFRDAWLNLN